MTEVMLRRYSEYKSSSEYFRQYAVMGAALANLTVPTTIVTAEDDPIIPVADFYDLKLNPLTDLIIHPYGGHNGFLENLSGKAWYEKKIMTVINALGEQA
jgi:predicted alpha/beta-fold hydrolase